MSARTAILLTGLLVGASFVSPAQQKKQPSEPAIPVYMVCPYHEDSLRTVYESAFPSATSALGVLSKRTDTLSIMVQKNSTQMASNLTWIYGLLILVTLMNIAMLVSLLQLRRQIADLNAASSNSETRRR